MVTGVLRIIWRCSLSGSVVRAVTTAGNRLRRTGSLHAGDEAAMLANWFVSPRCDKDRSVGIEMYMIRI
jgi:hypothetical protein